VIELDDASTKAWFRRGQACMCLGQYDAAVRNLTRACKLAPASREVRDEYEKAKAQAAAHKQGGFGA
jgi:hypothetical protein